MRAFLLRLFLFICLFGLIIYENNSKITISIFLFTIALLLFFFLSYNRTYVFLYYSLTSIIILHGIFINETFYTSLFILLFSIVAAFRLKEKSLIIYLMFNCLSLLLFIFYNNVHLIKSLLLISFVLYLLFKINIVEREKREQYKVYEQLLIEYRQLKRLYVLNERETRLEERTRIARELHDSVGHRLTALIMKLEMLSIQQKSDIFTELKEMANDSLHETREAVQALQTTQTEGITAVVHLIRKLEAESHLLIEFNLKKGVLTVPLSSENSATLYRVIQEALTNVMRHSQFKNVQITLAKSPINSLEFTIINPIEHVKQIEFGFGLKTMKKRVKEIGGQINIYQKDDQFIIKGTIPNKEGES